MKFFSQKMKKTNPSWKTGFESSSWTSTTHASQKAKVQSVCTNTCILHDLKKGAGRHPWPKQFFGPPKALSLERLCLQNAIQEKKIRKLYAKATPGEEPIALNLKSRKVIGFDIESTLSSYSDLFCIEDIPV